MIYANRSKNYMFVYKSRVKQIMARNHEIKSIQCLDTMLKQHIKEQQRKSHA